MTKLKTLNTNDAKSMAIQTDILGLKVHITNTSSAHTTHEIFKLTTMQNSENMAIIVVVGLPRSIIILAASWLVIL